MIDVTLFGGFSAIVMIGILVQIIKTSGIPTKWLPLSSLIIGVAVMALGTWTFSVVNVLTGIVLGSATAGFYDLSKKTILGK